MLRGSHHWGAQTWGEDDQLFPDRLVLSQPWPSKSPIPGNLTVLRNKEGWSLDVLSTCKLVAQPAPASPWPLPLSLP